MCRFSDFYKHVLSNQCVYTVIMNFSSQSEWYKIDLGPHTLIDVCPICPYVAFAHTGWNGFRLIFVECVTWSGHERNCEYGVKIASYS